MDTATLRATGVGRYVNAAFLGVWLTIWTVGEAFAIGGLIGLLLTPIGAFRDNRLTGWTGNIDRDAFGVVLVFLLLWLTLWTAGGVAALVQFLRSLAGSDRIRVVPNAIEVTQRAGPFRRLRTFTRAEIRGIRIRSHDGALVVDTAVGARLVSDLGTRAERESLCSALRDRLAIATSAHHVVDTAAPPPGWQVQHHDAGGLRMLRPQRGRRTAAIISWAITAFIAATWLAAAESPDGGVSTRLSLALMGCLTFGSAWLTWANEDWLVRRGRLVHRLQFGPWLKERAFENGDLEVVRSTDSDGDTQYRLVVRDGARKRTIESAIHDDAEVVACARWLAAATGFNLIEPD